MSVETAKSEAHSWERKLFRLALLVSAGIFFGAFVPLLGLVIFIPFFCIGLLWCYTGFAVVCVAFPVAFLLAKHGGREAIDSAISAVRWSVIAFVALGLVLFLSVFAIPGYKPFTLGYWIHARIWLNTAQVRDWATHHEATFGPHRAVPYATWPSSLKLASLGSGRVQIDPETKCVLLVDGGGFGHWGIRIAGPDAVDSSLGGNYALKLEPGAWVWHEMQ
jgi:hypothetical protein